ncbi:capsular polysaccharide synthesis protein [uncultured Limosilactobacillus sp.]|uniref:capsular polysaccharide synthesis protein n=1 Tax=uncultured Limosilactobacillus sp. TaxID=2837629 RepID=UPI0025924147|nr:capsular polysaccharide synthesis protein [uncultured Limosilactobacillus sp.]
MKKYVRKINYLEYIREYGLQLFISKAIRRFSLNNDSVFEKKINNYNEKLVLNRLNRIFKYEYFEEESYFKPKCQVPPETIWIMWWQGYNNAPNLVKACINSVKINNKNHNVIIITQENFKDYVMLPNFILKKFENGYISITHLSDIIRVLLLYNYGGLWIDSTVLNISSINRKVFDSTFFSVRTGLETKEPSHGEWATFFMASHPKNKLMKKIAVNHFKFWKNHNEVIDYIMFDYIIRLLVLENDKFSKQVLMVPINNVKTFELRKYINNQYSEVVDEVSSIKNDTILFKLSRKDNLLKKDGTVYSHILNKYLK